MNPSSAHRPSTAAIALAIGLLTGSAGLAVAQVTPTTPTPRTTPTSTTPEVPRPESPARRAARTGNPVAVGDAASGASSVSPGGKQPPAVSPNGTQQPKSVSPGSR